MTKILYPWKRFWCPREGSINLSDGGYLYDPDSSFGNIYNKDVITFNKMSNKSCLALLGEPGIGKTSAMQQEKKIIDNVVEQEGNKTFWLDLRSYGNEQRLVKRLFQNPDIEKWKESGYILYVFLDSLDECLLRIDTLSSLLIEELKELPVERLKLRIACRTAEWPATLESELVSLWGENNAGVYELTYLRKIDVIESAKANDIEPELFLKQIDEKEIVPLAIKPVTLNFLINVFKKIGKFPHTKNELYFQGCELLCEDPSESRRETGIASSFNSRQLLAVAARIAAITIFSNKFAVWTSINTGDIPIEDVTIKEIIGNSENADGNIFKVDEASIRETLKTGLFSSRGMHRMGWAHQTYAEFLAAKYLISHDLSIEKLKSIIFHSGDPQNKLIPQLYETSSWLSSMSIYIFNEIIKTNPEVLLRSDLRASDSIYKEKLIEKILSAYEKEEIYDVEGNLANNYKKLFFTGLPEKLRPYILDNKKNFYSRSAAIKIAKACGIDSLQDDILLIALDTDQNYHLRILAAFYVAQVGDISTKNKLKPLISSENFDDSDDELKGYTLSALWPEIISAEELFNSLKSPKKDNFIGSYFIFISQDLIKRLTINDLPVALGWVEIQTERQKLNYAMRKLIGSIMHKAWEKLESPGIIEPFARAVIARLKYYDDFDYLHDDKIDFREEIIKKDNKRRRVLEKIIRSSSDIKGVGRLLSSHFNPFVSTKDVLWMIDYIDASDSDEIKSLLASLIEFNFDINDINQIDAIIECCKKNSIVAKKLEYFFEPIPLNSPQAEAFKNRHLKMKEMTENDEEHFSLEPPPKIRIEELLKECESGKVESWWRLNMVMTLEEDSKYYGDDREYDLTKMPGWSNADDRIKARIIEVAKIYILTQDSNKSRWLGKNILYRPAIAGYRALKLLLKYDPDFFNSLNEGIWEKWAAIVLKCTADIDSDDDSKDEISNKKLLALAYQYSPTEVINTLNAIIDKENQEHSTIFILSKIKILWDEKIENALMSILNSKYLKPDSFEILLNELLEHDVSDAKEMAVSLVSAYSSGDTEMAIRAAKGLMSYPKYSEWGLIWSIIKKYPEFGKGVIEAHSHLSKDSHKILSFLTEEDLSELFVWMVQQYPYKKDDLDQSTRWLSPRDSAEDFKKYVLNKLTNMGTFKSCDEIRKLMKQFPELKWLNRNFLNALENARRKTWESPAPKEILQLVNMPENKLVQNGDQLLDVLIESLKRLETELQGETPAAIDLWNNVKGKYTPKDEEAFSNFLKRHLKKDISDRGIIVNREVEIRRGEGKGQGERTDIHIDAVTKKAREEKLDTITAIIEVKGCWNKHLKTDMKDQLVERYLKDNSCSHGLYLIGWFNCEQWDDEDYKKSNAPKMDIDEARVKFEKQAEELSLNGKKIKSFLINCSLR